MTESRGAMTAQQFRELITRHLTLNSFIDGDYLTGYLRFDDALRELNALSAHNTAQLTQERDENEQRWIDAIYELLKESLGPKEDYLIDGGGCDSGDSLDFALSEIAQGLAYWKERAESAEQAIMVDDKKLADALNINYCEDLIEDGTPWEVPAEPEPSYFESLHEAVVFLVNLPARNTAQLTERLARYEAKEACLPPLFDIADDCSAMLALEIVELRQRLMELRQRLTDYESADLQTIEAHAKELADHEKEVAELRTALEAAQNADKERLNVLHRKFGFVQDLATTERKCACAYCRMDAEALADHAAELECLLHLPGGFKERAEKAEAELSRLRSQGAGQWEAGRDAAAYVADAWRGEHGQMIAIRIRALQPPAGPSSRTEILLSAARVNCEFCRQGREVFRAGDNWEHPYEGSSTQCRSAEIRNLIGGQP